MRQISATELAQWLADPARPAPLLLDVRQPWEFDICRIAGARLLPMAELPHQLSELQQEWPADAPIVCICHHGARSLQVAAFLEQHGFGAIHNLAGGMHAWAREVDPAMATY
ncbi:MAG: rhodanese-like domain-containing protein [Burkholderiaceae bacterium]